MTNILNGIDLHIQDGEFVVLVGPSGCGKSTLLKCLVGLTPVTLGTITVGDVDVTTLPPAERDIALPFSILCLVPTHDGSGKYGFCLENGKGTRERRKVEEGSRVAEKLGLVDLLERYPKEMSGGQRQRVAIGRAIIRTPKVFCFDEPLSI